MAKGEVDIPAGQLREGARLYEEGSMHVSNSDYRAAISSFLRAMRVTFPDAVIWNDIAHCYLMLNDTENCKRALRSGLDADPENAECLHNLALVLRDGNELDEAEDLVTRATELEPGESGHWLTLGSVLFEQGDYMEALKALATGSGLAPDDPEEHHSMALVLDRLEEYERAEREFIRAVELASDRPEILADYGRFLTRLNRYTDARTFLQKAVEQDPLNYYFLTDLAEVMIEQLKEELREKRHDEDSTLVEDIFTTLTESMKSYSHHGKTWFLSGVMALMFEQYKEMEKSMRTAIEYGYDDPWAYGHLSYALNKLGRKKEAEEMFEEYRKRAEEEQQADR